MPEADFQKNREILKELLSQPFWDIPQKEESIRVASPILLSWLERRINQELEFGTMKSMFGRYDPLLQFEDADQGHQQGPMYGRIVLTHYQHKEHNLPKYFNDWVIRCLDDRSLIDRINALPQTKQDFYLYSIRDQVPKILDYGYSQMEDNFNFYTIRSLIFKYDPKKAEVDPEQIYGPLSFIHDWHFRNKKKGATLTDSLLSAIEDEEVKKRLSAYPDTYEEFAAHVINHHIGTILEKFEQVSTLFKKVQNRSPYPSYLISSIDLTKEYKDGSDLPTKSEEYTGSLFKIYTGLLQRNQDSTSKVATTIDWIVNSVKDPEKRKKLRGILATDRKNPDGSHYYATVSVDMGSRLRTLVEDYVPRCEALGNKGEFMTFFQYLRKFDPPLSEGAACNEAPSGKYYPSPVYGWLLQRRAGTENLTQTAARFIDNIDLKKRLLAFSKSSKEHYNDKYTEELNETIPIYIDQAWGSIHNRHKPLTLQNFYTNMVVLPDGSLKRESSKGTYHNISSFFSSRFKGRPLDDVLFEHLTEENQKKVAEIPTTTEGTIRHIINRYMPSYVQLAPIAIRERKDGIFSLQVFFSDHDPELPYEESDQGSRKGPLNKIITYFNQTVRSKTDLDFDAWVISQIDDSTVLGWVDGVPKTAQQKHAFLISQVADRYEEQAAHTIFYYLTSPKRKGKSIIRLSPANFIGRTDFSKDISDHNLYSDSSQGGTYGRAIRHYYKDMEKRESQGQSRIPIEEWLLPHMVQQKRLPFSTTAQHMTSSDPDIQEQAYKTYYPKYLDLCAHHQLPRSQILAPNDFVQKIF
ncbi:MAG: hypothetical protein ABIJ08_05225, partial [Nanoarchaeota archaeon]